MLQKRSITLAGHRTSLALEPDYWRVLELIASERAQSLPQLVQAIDETRSVSEPLASALRVYALNWAVSSSGDRRA